ncbi:helix-turn-helix domain-containing protein [Lactobacillus helveticus]|uniref:HTH domain-containing protein n=1 Tax=Lactobacillus helveticus TaxID=1587 RepID=A0A6A7K2L3_LACHE|nr:HTH domain-containing protein [Lactobacillus helveticus]
MKINENVIVEYLRKSKDIVTSDELSSKLNISKKTISRHIKQINSRNCQIFCVNKSFS